MVRPERRRDCSTTLETHPAVLAVTPHSPALAWPSSITLFNILSAVSEIVPRKKAQFVNGSSQPQSLGDALEQLVQLLDNIVWRRSVTTQLHPQLELQVMADGDPNNLTDNICQVLNLIRA